MPELTLEAMQRDNLVMSVARALALANETALAQGVEPANSLVTIAEDTSSSNRWWRIHYGRRDYVHHRGGDLTVFVDERGESIQRILRGQ